MGQVIDPLKFARECWPDVRLSREQQQIVYSVEDNDETFVSAGNELGKDFVAAFIALWWFCSRRPARVVTTSVKVDQLEDVLWGEIRRFLATSKARLPLQYNHLKIRHVNDDGSLYPNAELVGQVSNTQEGLLGRHSTSGFLPVQDDVPRTLVVFDEASGIDDATYTSTQTWAHRKLAIGNPWPCENFFKKGVKGGDLARDGGGYYRKVFRVRAEDSPNVRFALEELRRGLPVSNRIIVPGVKDYPTYLQNRKLWDKSLQCVGLDAEFDEGASVRLYPPEWLTRAEAIAASLGTRRRDAKAIGCDPAEGGDSSAWAIVDELGLIELLSLKTPDTSVIPATTLALMRRYGVPAGKVVFDRGGGGKQHADALRRAGHDVRTVAFGESPTPEPRRGHRRLDERIHDAEERTAFKNRRAELYWTLRQLLDPAANERGFGLPAGYTELRRQLSVFPLGYDSEGKFVLPPKNKRGENSKEKTLYDLLGCSPDEADSLALAAWGLLGKATRAKAGAF